MSRGVHRFALLVAGATFFLIVAGALVTSNDAGLATYDWPLSNGQVFPKMVGNLFWEHGHRMVATTVGLITIGFVVYVYEVDLRSIALVKKFFGRPATVKGSWRFSRESRSWIRRLGLIALAGVIAQGLLGGLTVKLLLPLAVSTAHATLAQLFFCTTVSLAVLTSPSWSNAVPAGGEKGSQPVRYLCLAAAAAIFLQLILGATLRHSATWDRPLPTDLLLSHIGGAVVVTGLLTGACVTILLRYSGNSFLTRPAKLALALMAVQLTLGLLAYITRTASPNDPQPLNPMISVTVAHVAGGALVFATTIVLTLRVLRVTRAEASTFTLAAATG